MAEPDSYASVNGQRVTRLVLIVAQNGPWIADVDFEGDPEPQSAATIQIGDHFTALGTFVKRSDGTFALQRRSRIVGGKNGWPQTVAPKQYHSEGGVRAQMVAEDAALAVGETIGSFLPVTERLGRDYVRTESAASIALTDAAGSGTSWWVDYAGVTHVGPRPAAALPAGSYTLLAHDPRDQTATLAMDDPGQMAIGGIITDERLQSPLTVRSFEIQVQANEIRVFCYCGGPDHGLGRLAALVTALVQRATVNRIFGAYRYRVVRMVGQRVELQAIRAAAGLPHLLPLSLWPGVPGAFPELTPGAEVLVSFIEGDPTQPIVTSFVGADGPGFVAVSLTLGGIAGAPAARLGDSVEVTLPPASFQGTVGGSPATGTVTWTPPQKAFGTITSGSSKVKVSP